jgi:hypothetical protein
LMAARLALPAALRGDRIGGRATAFRAIGLALVIGPADRLERRAGSSSLIRATDASESVRALAERRKCCVISQKRYFYLLRYVIGAISPLVYRKISYKIDFMPAKAKSWEDRARLYLKGEIAKADIGYEELAARLEKHGFNENAASIANKLARGTFAATFFLACLAALELEGVRLEDL